MRNALVVVGVISSFLFIAGCTDSKAPPIKDQQTEPVDSKTTQAEPVDSKTRQAENIVALIRDARDKATTAQAAVAILQSEVDLMDATDTIVPFETRLELIAALLPLDAKARDLLLEAEDALIKARLAVPSDKEEVLEIADTMRTTAFKDRGRFMIQFHEWIAQGIANSTYDLTELNQELTLRGKLLNAGCSNGVTNTVIERAKEIEPIVVKNTPPVHIVTLAHYNAIQEGMPFTEVTRIVGSAGVASPEIEEGKKWINWENPDGSFLDVLVDNNAVRSKMEEDLPPGTPGDLPPLLNAQNLANSAWWLKIDESDMTLQLFAGGTARITEVGAPLAIEGTWSVSGANLTVFSMGETISLIIDGDQIIGLTRIPAELIQAQPQHQAPPHPVQTRPAAPRQPTVAEIRAANTAAKIPHDAPSRRPTPYAKIQTATS